ncbi:helix-turn-helix transcriptional regulator [Photobacterium sanguinicancri]|uniref:Helix-turn-helix transcriptional regulator n=1 Tax=Photobacterium sanguinicancri TaxID=875932 RepID=A0AAW7Y5F6_9GAMM|nr:helix-turn-helix transcriptional regulator [Photobacterium sanguinicancri]MDO6541840.1 helix-turn-helix transcriptional regulator [Photobacterium sanguinicancri]
MNNTAWLTALTQAIDAQNKANFASALVAFIRQHVDFDCVVILGYSRQRRPVYLYDAISENRELLFQHYLNRSYVDDPFYRAFEEGLAEGVYLHDALADKLGINPDYVNDFYQSTGWHDEVGLVIPLDSDRWVVINLGYLQSKAAGLFSVEKKKQLRSLQAMFDVIAALSRQHWLNQSFLLADAPANNTRIRYIVAQAIDEFGLAVLTEREHAVLKLIVQGFDSKDIAQQLGIGLGTVKNHRKKIYASLNVSSVSELFGLFLNYLITIDAAK